MLYTDFEAGNKAYKLRLTTRNIIALEKAIGMNPLSVFGTGNRIPTITEMVNILHASLQQYQHGITVNDAYDIFDDYLTDGHTTTDFIPVIVEIYQTSGIMPKDKKEAETETEKN